MNQSSLKLRSKISLSSYRLAEATEKYTRYDSRKKELSVIFITDDKIGTSFATLAKIAEKDDSISYQLIGIEFGKKRRKKLKWIRIPTQIWNVDYLVANELVNNLFEDEMVIDSEVFDCNKKYNLVEFISCFKPSKDEEEIKKSKELFIRFIHNMMTNSSNDSECSDDYDEVYGTLENEGICSTERINYDVRIVKAILKYRQTGDFDCGIFNLIADNANNSTKLPEKAYIAIESTFAATHKCIENANGTLLYEGNVKIRKNCSTDFRKFIQRVSGDTEFASRMMYQIPIGCIVNLNGNIIGYKYHENEVSDVASIEDFDFEKQSHVFSCMSEIIDFINASAIFVPEEKGDSSLSLEKLLVSVKVSDENIDSYSWNSIESLYIFLKSSDIRQKECIVKMFFMLMDKYISKKYNANLSTKEMMDIHELSKISPLLFTRFVMYKQGNNANHNVYDELCKFIENHFEEKTDDNECWFDSRLCEDDYVFSGEITNKSNTNEVKWRETPITLSEYHAIKDERKKMIEDEISKDHPGVNLLVPKKLIYSFDKIDDSGMYMIDGSIYDPLPGIERFQVENLMSLDNKKLFEVCSRLFAKFKQHYASIIHYSDNFEFYIYYTSPKFTWEDVKGSAGYLYSNIFPEMVKKGYSRYVIDDFKYDFSQGLDGLSAALVAYSTSLDAYCQEHKMYFKGSNEFCPICGVTKYLVPEDYEQKCSVFYSDKVGTHYVLNNEYFLKVYKDEAAYKVLMPRVKKNIESGSDFTWVKQDLFIPTKLAMLNGKAIGYVYKAIRTATSKDKDYCMELRDTERIKTNYRLKALERLVSQVWLLFENGYQYAYNPFGAVYLNLCHSKQVQIINVDYLYKFQVVSDNMFGWLLDYVKDAINCDRMLVIKNDSDPIFNSEKYLRRTASYSFSSLFNDLQEIESRLAQCPVHECYYNKNYVFCPKCTNFMVDFKFLNGHVKKVDGFSAFENLEHVNEGGEALIYKKRGKGGYVDKIFKHDKKSNVNFQYKTSILLKIISRIEKLKQLDKIDSKSFFIIPETLYYDEKSQVIIGYDMKEVKNAYPISDLRDVAILDQLGFGRSDIIEILITVGKGIELLHSEANMYIGDLNGRNILFDSKKNVYFIDFDGMGIDEFAPAAYTEGYIDPISADNHCITMKDDWYSFAIQAFYYLTHTHPFNGIYLQNRKPVDIVNRMRMRISLLGNHGIPVPDIAISWDWMSKELVKVFLNTFEGDYRESIVKELQGELDKLRGVRKEPVESITKKFDKLVNKSNTYQSEVVCAYTDSEEVFTPNLYSGYQDHLYGLYVMENGKRTFIAVSAGKIVDCQEYKDLVVINAVNNRNVNTVVAYSRKNRKMIEVFSEESSTVALLANNVYRCFYNVMKGKSYIEIYTIDDALNVKMERLRNGNNTVKQIACIDRKYLMVEAGVEKCDEVFGNAEQITSFNYDSFTIQNEARYKILFDSAKKFWVIINNYGKTVVIKMNGEINEYDTNVDGNSLNGVLLLAGKLCIPGNGCVYVINLENGNSKTIDDIDVVTPKSKIVKVIQNGFELICADKMYDVTKIV